MSSTTKWHANTWMHTLELHSARSSSQRRSGIWMSSTTKWHANAARQYLDELNFNHKVACEHPDAHPGAAFGALPTELLDCGDVIRADSEFEFPTPGRQVRRQRPRRDEAQTPLKLRGQRESRRASRAVSGASASVQAAMSELCLHRCASAPAGSPGPCNCHNTCRP